MIRAAHEGGLSAQLKHGFHVFFLKAVEITNSTIS